jgi:hypothetical protein
MKIKRVLSIIGASMLASIVHGQTPNTVNPPGSNPNSNNPALNPNNNPGTAPGNNQQTIPYYQQNRSIQQPIDTISNRPFRKSTGRDSMNNMPPKNSVK